MRVTSDVSYDSTSTMLKPTLPSAPAASMARPSTAVPLRTLTSMLSGLSVPGGSPRKMLRAVCGLAHQRDLHVGAGRRGQALARDAVPDEVVGVELREGAAEAEQVAGVEVLVEAHVGHAGRHELVERDRVAEALAHRLGDGPPDEDLLAGDATEVGGGVAVPVAVLVLVLEVARPGELAGLLAVEHLALRLGDVEARCGESRTRRVEPHRDAADRVDELLEADEVDLHVVVDRDAEVVLDGVDQRLLAVGVRAC